MHIGFVAPLPPTRSGVATYADQQLRLLCRKHQVTAYLDAPDSYIDPPHCELLGLDRLADTQADVVLYHLGNSLGNLPQVSAAMTGPPGVIELHDGSLHHLFEAISLGLDDSQKYCDVLADVYGEAGAELAQARTQGSRGSVELALFDLLSPVLSRHRRVIAHSKWAQLQVARRAPRVESVVVPLPAPESHRALPRGRLGLSGSDLLIGHAGFVTEAKRPDVMVDVVRRVRMVEPDTKLVLLGADRSEGLLSAAIHEAGMSDAVICTGYLSTDELHGYLATMDVAIALRSPHVGESSGPVAAAFAAGVPVVTQAIGAWAELPEAATLFAPITDDETQSIADAVTSLLANPARRARMGAAARKVATGEWSARRCANLVVDALEHFPQVPLEQPAWLPDTVNPRTVIAVETPKVARELSAAGAAVSELRQDELISSPVGAASLVLWGSKNATMGSLANANRCLEGLGKLLWLDPPKLAAEALNTAGFSDIRVPPQAETGSPMLVATKTHLPVSRS
jgi:glycosyltransferase involved in cell wall biosynthesis